jgi:hypothetical protein
MRFGRRRENAVGSRLFRGCDLFNRRCLSVGLLGWSISLGQELVDYTSALLLLDASLMGFVLFGPKVLVYFPAH